MNLRRIGDRLVPPTALGTMLMTLPHPSPGVHEQPIEPAQARRTIHAALDAGVRAGHGDQLLHVRGGDGP